MKHGVAPYPGVVDALRPWAERFAVPMPEALGDTPRIRPSDS